MRDRTLKPKNKRRLLCKEGSQEEETTHKFFATSFMEQPRSSAGKFSKYNHIDKGKDNDAQGRIAPETETQRSGNPFSRN